jgi:hypothetical protein
MRRPSFAHAADRSSLIVVALAPSPGVHATLSLSPLGVKLIACHGAEGAGGIRAETVRCPRICIPATAVTVASGPGFGRGAPGWPDVGCCGPRSPGHRRTRLLGTPASPIRHRAEGRLVALDDYSSSALSCPGPSRGRTDSALCRVCAGVQGGTWLVRSGCAMAKAD